MLVVIRAIQIKLLGSDRGKIVTQMLTFIDMKGGDNQDKCRFVH